MQVKEIMTKEVKFIDPNCNHKRGCSSYAGKGRWSFTCGENDRLIGVITDRDITIRAIANGHDPESVTIKK